MEELRNALDELEEETGKHYGITAALPCGPTHLQNINVPELSKHLSELNVSAEVLRFLTTFVVSDMSSSISFVS
jgi:hypothetical protein